MLLRIPRLISLSNPALNRSASASTSTLCRAICKQNTTNVATIAIPNNMEPSPVSIAHSIVPSPAINAGMLNAHPYSITFALIVPSPPPLAVPPRAYPPLRCDPSNDSEQIGICPVHPAVPNRHQSTLRCHCRSTISPPVL